MSAGSDEPRPRKDGEGWCTSLSPMYPGSHGYSRCWGKAEHAERMHVSGGRRWSDRPPAEDHEICAHERQD